MLKGSQKENNHFLGSPKTDGTHVPLYLEAIAEFHQATICQQHEVLSGVSFSVHRGGGGGS